MVTNETTSLHEVFSLITEERNNQDIKHPNNDHSPEYWLAILVEEVGEAAKEIVERQSILKLRAELVQVATTAVRMLQCLPNPGPSGNKELIQKWIQQSPYSE